MLSDKQNYLFQYYNLEYMIPKMLRKVLFEDLPYIWDIEDLYSERFTNIASKMSLLCAKV